MLFHDLLHHGKADAQAAGCAGAAGVGAPEALEHHLRFLGRKADAGIAHHDLAHKVALLGHHRDGAAFGRVAHGVRNQVRRGLAQQVGIAVHVHVRVVLELQAQALFVDVRLMGGNNRREHFGKVHLLALDGLGAAFQAGKLQQRIYQARKAAHLGVQRFQALLVGLEHAVDHGFHRGLDGHQRGAQLVGHIGYQAPFQLAVLLHGIGHQVEHVAQAGDLVVALHAGAGGVVAFLQGLRRVGDAADGRRQAAGEHAAHHAGHHDGDNAGQGHGLVRLLAELRVGLGKQRFGAVHAHVHGAHLLIVHDDGRGGHVAAGFLGAGLPQCPIGRIVVHHGAVLRAHLDEDGIVQGAGRRGRGQRAVVPVAVRALIALRNGLGRGIGDALDVLGRVGLEVLLPHHRDNGDAGNERDQRNRQGNQHHALGEREVEPFLFRTGALFFALTPIGAFDLCGHGGALLPFAAPNRNGAPVPAWAKDAPLGSARFS